MKLMIVDEELIAGGVEAIQLNVIPELCAQVEKLYWFLPSARIEYFRVRIGAIENLTFISLDFSTNFLFRLLSWGRNKSIWGREKLLLFLRNQRLKQFYRRMSVDACITTCMFEQAPFPEGMRRGGILCDLNVQGERRVSFLHNIKQWVENSEIVFPISKYTEKELCRNFPVFSSRFKTVPLAANVSKNKNRLWEKKGTVFYYPASIMPHKNHYLLLRAFEKLLCKGDDLKLILTGGGTEKLVQAGNSEKHVIRCRDLIQDESNELSKVVQAYGYIDTQEVDRLYAQASCIILPSAMEGYGLPLAEALAFGKPVICSDIEPFREQADLYHADNRVIFFKNNSLDSLVQAIESFLLKPLVAMSYSEIEDLMQRWTFKNVANSYLQELQGTLK